jgi:hypothetical protein
MKINQLFEGQPSRQWNPEVVEWIYRAYSRLDLPELYLHGSNARFDAFKQPNLNYGQLIFFSKLSEHPEYETQPLQAEYYGPNLYLVKIAPGKVFSPYPVPEGEPDPHGQRQALAILAQSLPPSGWDREQKLRWGRLDYQDLHHVVPLAVRYGYKIFRVLEVSMGKESYGVTDPALITIVDRLFT